MHTADEKQSPCGVGVTRLFSASAMLTAVEAADDLPLICVIAPPAHDMLSLRKPNRFNLVTLQLPLTHGTEMVHCALKLHSSGTCSPLFATVGVKSSLNQVSSPMTSIAGSPAILAFRKSGTCAPHCSLHLYLLPPATMPHVNNHTILPSPTYIKMSMTTVSLVVQIQQ